jgi:hypothetical protein
VLEVGDRSALIRVALVQALPMQFEVPPDQLAVVRGQDMADLLRGHTLPSEHPGGDGARLPPPSVGSTEEDGPEDRR